jgi:WXG100 family type VII secretion target
MPTLHMDVESCRSTQSNLVNQHQQLVNIISQMTNQVNSTIGSAWIGGSATEFQQQFEQLRSSLNAQMDQLNQLSSNLANEITQWESMAARMG